MRRAPMQQQSSMRGLRWLLCVVALERTTAPCSGGDKACQRGCASWCSHWTCTKYDCRTCGKHQGCNDKPPPPPTPPPVPALPPWDLDVEANTLNIYGHNGAMYANGKRLHIKGVNWFGSEGRSGPPLGLDKHHIDWCVPARART